MHARYNGYKSSYENQIMYYIIISKEWHCLTHLSSLYNKLTGPKFWCFSKYHFNQINVVNYNNNLTRPLVCLCSQVYMVSVYELFTLFSWLIVLMKYCRPKCLTWRIGRFYRCCSNGKGWRCSSASWRKGSNVTILVIFGWTK